MAAETTKARPAGITSSPCETCNTLDGLAERHANNPGRLEGVRWQREQHAKECGYPRGGEA